MQAHKQGKKISPLDITMMLLSTITLGLIITRLWFDVGTETANLLFKLDTLVCCILLSHLAYGCALSEDKAQYLKQHWIDILASLPLSEHLRYFRLLQIIRITQALYQGKNVLQLLKSHYQETTIASVILLLISVLTVGSISILMVESNAPGASILTAADAFWWTIVTVSTVGYGDLYPVSDAGRIVASFIILSGIGTFAAVSGLMASILVPQVKPDPQQQALLYEVQRLQAQIAQLQKQQTTNAGRRPFKAQKKRAKRPLRD
ncbi:ion channel [Motilimonas pumila]|uniref:Ion transporter n=1 Tax=Motilimonas pumila TaxID=2303987 RepID=A0A418YAZ8_9GAMM|nr:ion channel [Motilimonas pumila]RJG40093.1 ion transporter [Motilimonas pumila]